MANFNGTGIADIFWLYNSIICYVHRSVTMMIFSIVICCKHNSYEVIFMEMNVFEMKCYILFLRKIVMI